jgi:conjugative transfer region protein TrbK
MRRRPFRFSAIARSVAYGAVAAAIVATSLHLQRYPVALPASVEAPTNTRDPLAPELARCQALGMAAKDDAACEATWAANRRRFFSLDPADNQIGARPANPKTE